MKKEIPILFSTNMVKAILEGRKTQTRRIVKYQADAERLRTFAHDWERKEFISRCPFGKPGDFLYVRETWVCKDGKIYYKADCSQSPKYAPWRPSIHMPKEIARIWLEITDIRIERLHEITEDDAKAEGIEYKLFPGEMPGFGWKEYTTNEFTCLFPSSSFQSLWEKINSPESWQQNLWVWVIEFKVLSTTGKPGDPDDFVFPDDLDKINPIAN